MMKFISNWKDILKITGIIWLADVVDKLSWKHQVTPSEVEEAVSGKPIFCLNLNYPL